MIGAIIKYGNNSLTTELPVEALRLHNQLGSIGIPDRADKIRTGQRRYIVGVVLCGIVAY